MNRSTPEKRHALNKRVRREKARLRKGGPKKHPQKATIKPGVRMKIKLTPEVAIELKKYCEENNVKEHVAIKRCIALKMAKDEGLLDGVQEESNIKVDKDSE